MTRRAPLLLAVILLGACGGGPPVRSETTTARETQGSGAPPPRVVIAARGASIEQARRAAGTQARVIEVAAVAASPLARVAASLDQARALYRDLAFEESLGAVAEASVVLTGAPDTVETRELRHQALVLRATNQIALGRVEDARGSLIEAVRLRPDAQLDEARHPPDVRTAYDAARAEVARGGTLPPAPPLPDAASPGGVELVAGLLGASYAAIADLPEATRTQLGRELSADVLVIVRGSDETIAVDLASGRTRTALPGEASLRVLIGETRSFRGVTRGTGILAQEEPDRGRPDEADGDGDGGGVLASPWFWIVTGVVVAGGTTAGVLVLTDDPGAIGVAGSGFE
jgi:hypothetical protein